MSAASGVPPSDDGVDQVPTVSTSDPAAVATLQPLPLHRVALRMLVLGVLGGLPAAVPMAAAEGRRGSWIVMCLAIAPVWCALLVLAEALAARVRPARRALVVFAAGAGAGVAMACAAVWVQALASGRGPLGAAEAVAQLVLSEVLSPNHEGVMLGLTAGLPFVLLGTGRSGGLPRVRPPLGVLGSTLLGGAAGALSFVVFFSYRVLDGWHGDYRYVLVPALLFFLAGPTVAALGLCAGEKVEPWLAARLARIGTGGGDD